MKRWSLLLLTAAVTATTACEESDLGEACGSAATTLEGTIIDGEAPVGEVVRLERDGACESFKCITHGGLAPYCTDTCTYKTSSSNKACAQDGDCPTEESCVGGQCKDDSCPAGFWCRQVQSVGPIASERYCVRQEGCSTNFDCESLGDMECRKVGCLDSCLLAGSPCEVHALTCQPIEELPCRCPGAAVAGEGQCTDLELSCQPQDASTSWEVGAVAQRSVCVGKQQTATQALSTP